MAPTVSSFVLVSRSHPQVQEQDLSIELAQHLTRKLLEQGHTVDYVGVFTRPVSLELCQFISVSSRKLGPAMFSAIFAARALFLPLRGPKLFHAFDPLAAVCIPFFFPRVPLLVSLHDTPQERAKSAGLPSKLLHALEAYSLRNATCVVAASQETLAANVEVYGNALNDEAKCRVVEKAQSTGHFFRGSSQELQRRYGADKFFIVAHSRFQSEEGVQFLLKLWSTQFQDKPTMMLLIVGEGPCRETLEAQSSSMCTWNRPRFLGALPEAQRGAVLRSAQCYFHEPADTTDVQSLQEAVACGIPIVIDEDDMFVEQVVQGEMGYRIPMEPDVAVQALEALSKEMISRESVENFHRITSDAHSVQPDTTFAEYSELYQHVLRGR